MEKVINCFRQAFRCPARRARCCWQRRGLSGGRGFTSGPTRVRCWLPAPLCHVAFGPFSHFPNKWPAHTETVRPKAIFFGFCVGKTVMKSSDFSRSGFFCGKLSVRSTMFIFPMSFHGLSIFKSSLTPFLILNFLVGHLKWKEGQ